MSRLFVYGLGHFLPFNFRAFCRLPSPLNYRNTFWGFAESMKIGKKTRLLYHYSISDAPSLGDSIAVNNSMSTQAYYFFSHLKVKWA